MRVTLLVLSLLFAVPALAQEKHVASDASVRTNLSFKVSDAALQKLLPTGWELNTATSGPSAGVNLRVSFIESIWVEDAQGKPGTPAGRTVTISVPVKKTGASAGVFMLFGGLSTAAGAGSYGVFTQAMTTSRRTFERRADGVTLVELTWDAKVENGDSVQLQLQYAPGPITREKLEQTYYSGAKPNFYRVYRFTQVSDVLRGGGADRVKVFAFKASGPLLGPLFDGTEQIISIVAIPYYSRQIFLPDS